MMPVLKILINNNETAHRFRKFKNVTKKEAKTSKEMKYKQNKNSFILWLFALRISSVIAATVTAKYRIWRCGRINGTWAIRGLHNGLVYCRLHSCYLGWRLINHMLIGLTSSCNTTTTITRWGWHNRRRSGANNAATAIAPLHIRARLQHHIR